MALSLTLIISNKKDLQDALGVVIELISRLPQGSGITEQSAYPKFESSYKFEILIPQRPCSDQELLFHMATITSLICEPWTFYWRGQETELIFNAAESASYTAPIFNTIRWAHLQTLR